MSRMSQPIRTTIISAADQTRIDAWKAEARAAAAQGPDTLRAWMLALTSIDAPGHVDERELAYVLALYHLYLLLPPGAVLTTVPVSRTWPVYRVLSGTPTPFKTGGAITSLGGYISRLGIAATDSADWHAIIVRDGKPVSLVERLGRYLYDDPNALRHDNL